MRLVLKFTFLWFQPNLFVALFVGIRYNIEVMVYIGNDWDKVLEGEFEKEYYLNLRKFLINEYKTQTVYPGMNDIFNALKFTPYEDVKAVIIGQDPYHQPGQAHGLCFSVQKPVPAPPSLVNI